MEKSEQVLGAFVLWKDNLISDEVFYATMNKIKGSPSKPQSNTNRITPGQVDYIKSLIKEGRIPPDQSFDLSKTEAQVLGIPIRENHIFYMELLDKKRQRQKEIYNEFKHIIKGFIHWIFVVVQMIAIGLISALVGVGSKPLIFSLNKSLGEGYSLYASYVESAMVGIILFYCLFDKYKKNEN